ncbi:hypothetical protein DRO61_00890 [Candidatus Bathyarchaeota archaeon]|nr:MAG: hypothetical protein DRO61_00890 [Candidatus Bathyarchaeota archaeon]
METPKVKDDEKAKYDLNKHRYILETAWVAKQLSRFSPVLTGDKEMSSWLADLTSRQTYNNYYDQKHEEDFFKAEYILALEENREFIIAGLLGQIEYALVSGGHMILLQPGISVKSMTNLQRKVFEDAGISDETKKAFRRKKLLYKDRLDFTITGNWRVGY